MTEVDIQDIVAELGIRQGNNKGDYTEYYCPVHDNKTPDLAVYQNDFTCYSGERQGGNAVSLLMHCEQMNSVEEAMEWLEDHFPEKDFSDLDEETVERRKEVREILNRVSELAHQELKNHHEELYEFIKDYRNFDDKVMEEAQIGFISNDLVETIKQRYDKEVLIDSGLFYDKDGDFRCRMWNRVVFPYIRGEQVWYMIGGVPKNNAPEPYGSMLEDSPAKYKKLKTTEYNKHIVYQWQEDSDNKDTVLITEGITDAISAHKAGYNVSSPVTTQYSDEDINRVCKQAKHFKTVYICMDADSEGRKGAEKTAHELAKHGVEARIVDLGSGDLDDYTTEHGYDIEEVLEDSTYYINYLMEEVEDAHRTEKSEKKKKVWEAIYNWEVGQKKEVFKLFGNKQEAKQEYKAWEEQKQEEEKRQQKKEELPDQTSSEDQDQEDVDITDELSIPESEEVIHINPRPTIYINQVKDTATETQENTQGTIMPEPKFKVLEAQYGEGEDATTYKLLVEPYKQIHLGENNLPIKKANLMKEKYRKSDYFKQEYREVKSENENFTQRYEEWLKGQEGSEYIELQEQIDERSKEVVEGLNNETILSLVQEYMEAGWNVDAKLMNIMYPQSVQHKKNRVKPGNVAKYQPHTQLWTNTKVGKSKTGGRVGAKFDDATPAGLLGYADSDGKQEGQIDGLERPVFIDEFNFGSSSRQLNDQLLSLMEEGKFKQSKAGHTIQTRFYGNLTYLANPKDGDMPEKEEEKNGFADEYTEDDDRGKFELVTQFEELIQYLGMNIQAMASRMGIVVFDEEMEKANPKEESLSDERFDRLESFFEWVRDRVAYEYTDIERECRDWLEQEYEDDYVDRIHEVAEDTSNEKVEKFWKNHIHSHRHARGQVLRMAVFQHIGDVVKKDYSIEEILEEADRQWETVKEINRESLENMTEATSEEQEESRARSKLDNYRPKYMRLFVKTVIKHSQQGNVDPSKRKVFVELKDTWQDLKHELPDDDVQENSKYWKWSKLMDAVEDKVIQKRMQIKNDFGIQMTKANEEFLYRVAVPERFKTFQDLEIGEPAVDSGSGDDSNDDDDDDGGRTTTDSGEDIEIEGDYKATPQGLEDLFRDNEDKYENREIPESDIVNHFGRKYGGKKHNKVMDSIDKLSSEGRIQETSSGVWQIPKG